MCSGGLPDNIELGVVNIALMDIDNPEAAQLSVL